MPVDAQQLRRRLREFDFTGVMVEELGWNYHRANPLQVAVDGQDFDLNAVAEKSGLVVYSCGGDGDGQIPPYPIRQKIERQVAKATFEHLVIFHDAARTTQYWQWVRRQAGKPAAWREQVYRPNQTEEPLIQKLQSIDFELEDEEQQNIALVAGRVRGAFDVERVTKRFYDRFKTEHDVFLEFIEGMNSLADREWYASLMLNRLMFVYFIQKKGFLDGDHDYLRDRLEKIKQTEGKDKFQRFYRLFLLRLFHEGLAQPESDRTPELAQLLGTVPFLNGGLFEVHDLEKDNPDVHIPDEAFEKLFKFFDEYTWHLDERPLRADKEINPDVLGYIFEKYINQKELGAYYTKEDITGYISRNTVIPSLFDAARKECPVAFQPDGGVWRLLQEEPDRYIYPPVKQGMDLTLPPEIAAGIDDVSQRQGWNRPAPEGYALPTETWREVVARRKRYEEVWLRLASGEVNDINELLTLNLDICRFAEDVIIQSEGPELVKAFWDSLEKISVLDPACGSGAFLFAALNVLEPLYTACLEGMRGFLDDLERSLRRHHPDALKPFRDVLEQMAKHPNQRYFALKSIVINNLYGVDIVEEAVEICKLRLFLKLVAQVETYEEIEPLPDIDFNIRSGNSLVGFTSLDAVRHAMTIASDGRYRMLDEEKLKTLDRINEDAEIADRAYQKFREMQTLHGMDADSFIEAKAELRRRLDGLRGELDLYLANQYGIDAGRETYRHWQVSHQPFHWFVEFYGIMNSGGFDAVIGNPPYVEYKNIRATYEVRDFLTENCRDLYAYVLERSCMLQSGLGHLGMIVPVSVTSTEGFKPLRDLLANQGGSSWTLSFAERPSKLFEGVEKRLSIWLLSKRPIGDPNFVSNYRRWRSEEREHLLETSRLIPKGSSSLLVGSSIPKISTPEERGVLDKLFDQPRLASYFLRTSPHVVYYTRKVRYFVQFFDFVPSIVKSNGEVVEPSELKMLYLASNLQRDVTIALLNSNLFFWYFNAYSDVRNLNRREIEAFPCSLGDMSGETTKKLQRLAGALMDDFTANSKTLTNDYGRFGRLTIQTFQPRLSKGIIDDIDAAIAAHYGFTDEELDFIINYDIKYRMGGAESDEE